MPEEQRIKELIITWHDKSLAEADIFSVFVFSWFCFNAWIELNSSKNTDAAMIKELADKKTVQNELLHAYITAFTDSTFQKHVSELVTHCPIYDERGKKTLCTLQILLTLKTLSGLSIEFVAIFSMEEKMLETPVIKNSYK